MHRPYHQWLDDNPVLEEAAVFSHDYILNNLIFTTDMSRESIYLPGYRAEIKAFANSSS
jgi:hypothetical protein